MIIPKPIPYYPQHQLIFTNKDYYKILDENNNIIAIINFITKEWCINEYNDKGYKTQYKRSNGYHAKWKYDNNGNEIQYENSDGRVIKREYNNQQIYYEDSNGYQKK